MKAFSFLPLLLLGLGACHTPPPEPWSQQDLTQARQLYEAGEYSKAWSAIRSRRREEFDRASQRDYSLLAGNIAYARQDWDGAIRHYEEFISSSSLASEAEEVEHRLYQMGLDLLQGKRLAFGIFPDRSRGIATLHNLATWAPRSPYAAQALAAVANYNYGEQRFDEAAADYRMILQAHPSSDFADLATIRLGMCGARRIDGPWVDGQLIERSANQLRKYLEDYASGLYREEARKTLDGLIALGAERELVIGDYYRTIGNVRGARYHYQLAAQSKAVAPAAEGKERLAQLPAEDPPLPEPKVPD